MYKMLPENTEYIPRAFDHNYVLQELGKYTNMQHWQLAANVAQARIVISNARYLEPDGDEILSNRANQLEHKIYSELPDYYAEIRAAFFATNDPSCITKAAMYEWLADVNNMRLGPDRDGISNNIRELSANLVSTVKAAHAIPFASLTMQTEYDALVQLVGGAINRFRDTLYILGLVCRTQAGYMDLIPVLHELGSLQEFVSAQLVPLIFLANGPIDSRNCPDWLDALIEIAENAIVLGCPNVVHGILEIHYRLHSTYTTSLVLALYPHIPEHVPEIHELLLQTITMYWSLPPDDVLKRPLYAARSYALYITWIAQPDNIHLPALMYELILSCLEIGSPEEMLTQHTKDTAPLTSIHYQLLSMLIDRVNDPVLNECGVPDLLEDLARHFAIQGDQP